jgi:RNA polymerase sigma-70 factor, ECF subfamily
MSEGDWLANRFEQNTPHLRAVAYRMLGSAAEADDAVQEAWLRLSRSSADGVQNLAGWLTTTVARVCLDMLRARKARREEPLPAQPPGLAGSAVGGAPSRKRCWLTRLAWRCWWCSIRWALRRCKLGQ